MFNFASETTYTITLNVKDLLWGILILALIVLVIFIIALIGKAIKNLSATHKIIQMNQEHISKIIQNASDISTDASSISSNVSHATGAFRPSVDNIAEATEDITRTFKDNNSVNEAILKAYKVVNKAGKMASKYKDKKEAKAESKKDCTSEMSKEKKDEKIKAEKAIEETEIKKDIQTGAKSVNEASIKAEELSKES